MISCREYALKLLTFKDRTEKEISDKLNDKGYTAEDITQQLAFLKEYGYIDDSRYAQRFTTDAIKLKKWGKARIRMELVRRGVDKMTVEEVLEQLCVDSCDVVKHELERKFGNVDFTSMKERNRVFAYFARRGFNPSEIRSAMNEMGTFDDTFDGEY